MATIEELKETFRKFDKDYVEFKKIKNPPSKRPDLCAFLLLDKLVPGGSDIVTQSGHDEFFLEIDVETLAERATEDDVLYLVRCGVRYSSEFDCLSMFT